MKKKVLIISTSLRGGSNSEILAKECEKGAKAAGHDVQFLSLKEKEVKYCIGWLSWCCFWWHGLDIRFS